MAIIGAGPSGLVAAKCMLEAGLAPSLFDQAPSLGGLWGRYPGNPQGHTDGTPQAAPGVENSASAVTPGACFSHPNEELLFSSQTEGQGRYTSGEPGSTGPGTGERGAGEGSRDGRSVSAPGCWGSLRTNLSRFTCSFSDHSWDDNCPLFVSAPQLHEYLLSYAQRFLLPNPDCRFHFQTRVLSVSPIGEGRQWRLELQELESPGGQEKGPEVRIFDYGVVASGLYETAMRPAVPGLGAFPGCTIHSAEYRSAAPFAGKRVAVVGASFSGVDIAADVAHVAADVAHIVTQELWVLPRYIPHDPSSPAPFLLPLDLALYRRTGRESPAETLPTARGEASRKEANAHFRRLLCGDPGSFRGSSPGDSLPMEGENSGHPRVAISDDYSFLVQAEKITVHRGRLVGVGAGTDSSALVLESDRGREGEESDERGESEESEGGRVTLSGFDAIILCTGFGPSLPFLSEELKRALGYDPTDRLQPLLLHKATFPPSPSPSPSPPNLAFVGMYRGPYFAAMELQAKWAAAVFSQSLPPPSEEAIQEGIEAEKGIRDQVPRPQFPHGDYVGFCNDLGRELGFQEPWDEQWAKEHDVVLPSQYALQAGTCESDNLANTADSLSPPTDSPPRPTDSLSTPSDNLLHPSACTDVLAVDTHTSGVRSAHGTPAHRQSPEVQLERVREASWHGAGIPAAVFRGLVGTWTLHRTIESRGEGLPSGTVEGVATFTPRLWRAPEPASRHKLAQTTAGSNAGLPTDPRPGSAGAASQEAVGSGAQICQVPGVVGANDFVPGGEQGLRGEPELLYREEGHFIGPRGTRHRIWKEYVYSCQDAESQLSVLFAEHSQRTYLFHTLKFLPQPQREGAPVGGKGDAVFAAMPVKDGWRATGEHLCGEDMYYASYRFAFSGLQLCRFCIVYRVLGPHKDYTSTTLFERASQ